MDDTGTRVDGVNWHCQVICNPLYTAYFTTERKDRLTVIDVLRNQRERVFRLNDETVALLRQFAVSERTMEALRHLPWDQELSETELEDGLKQHLPQLGATARSRIVEASAIAAYHAEVGHPVVRLLICDDAKQFKLVTAELALCWIHDGRHYKNLEPCVVYHRQLLDAFLTRYWDYYKELLAYRQQPSAEEAMRLSGAFDQLFSTVTDYAALDQRIAKTQANKGQLLMVLRHPEIPLHNNPAELDARRRVRKRVVSYGPRSEQGAKAWDTLQTLFGKPDGRRSESGLSGIYVPLLRGPERARVAVFKCESVGEGSEEGTGEVARDDQSSAVPQADPETDRGVEPVPEGLEELLRLWVSTPSLPRDQLVRPLPSHAASE